MRFALLAAIAALLLAGAHTATASEVKHQQRLFKRVPRSSGESAPISSQDLEQTQIGLMALQKLADNFNSKIFDNTTHEAVAKTVSESFSFISSFMNLISSHYGTSTIRTLRLQFANTFSKLNEIDLHLEEVKNLIEWSTTRRTYAECELHIETAAEYFDAYVKSSITERETRKSQFVDFFKYRRAAAFQLYQAVVENQNDISRNLEAAVVHYTKNYRRQVTEFLLAMTRLILRGAQFEVAYERLTNSEASAQIIKNDWTNRIRRLIVYVYATELQVKRAVTAQSTIDTVAILKEKKNLSNKDFTNEIYNFLADKYDGRNWFVLVVERNILCYAATYCKGSEYLKTFGDRSLFIGWADPKSSTFTKSYGDQIMTQVDNMKINTTEPGAWTAGIRNKLGGSNFSCNRASAFAAVSYGCGFWVKAPSGHVSHRIMTTKPSVNGIIFG